MKRAGIPDTPGSIPADQQRFFQALKENIEVVEGRRGGKIAVLPSTATLADTIAKINEILAVMQG